jgi:hypothetical protein
MRGRFIARWMRRIRETWGNPVFRAVDWQREAQRRQKTRTPCSCYLHQHDGPDIRIARQPATYSDDEIQS